MSTYKIFLSSNATDAGSLHYHVMKERYPGSGSYASVNYAVRPTEDIESQLEEILDNVDDNLIDFLKREGASGYQLMPMMGNRLYTIYAVRGRINEELGPYRLL